MESTLRLIINKPADPVWNMHKDKTLFKEGKPAVRFYSWKEKAFSIGYFQSIAEVRAILPHEDKGCPIVRRPTGGGVVEHGRDITYSIILPYPEQYGLGKTEVSYNKIHGIIRSAVCALDGRCSISFFDGYFKPAGHERKSYFCFQKPTRYDLMYKGIKIGGSAQRRTNSALLHQGSLYIQMSDRVKKEFIQSFYVSLQRVSP